MTCRQQHCSKCTCLPKFQLEGHYSWFATLLSHMSHSINGQNFTVRDTKVCVTAACCHVIAYYILGKIDDSQQVRSFTVLPRLPWMDAPGGLGRADSSRCSSCCRGSAAAATDLFHCTSKCTHIIHDHSVMTLSSESSICAGELVLSAVPRPADLDISKMLYLKEAQPHC